MHGGILPYVLRHLMQTEREHCGFMRQAGLLSLNRVGEGGLVLAE